MSIILYSFAPQDRSGRVRWTLEELNIPYELKMLDWEKKEHKSLEYIKIHPMGAVPVLIDGETTLFESGAILMYLADKYRKPKALSPEIDTPARAEYLKWLMFSAATLDSKFIKVFEFLKLVDETDRKAKLSELYGEFEVFFNWLDTLLAKNKFIAGNTFSVADIMLAQPLQWAMEGGFLKNHKVTENYFTELKKRPAAEKSLIFSPES